MIGLVLSVNLRMLRWVTRAPTMTNCFFLSFIVFVDMRSFLESELMGQLSLTTVLFVATWLYAGQANREAFRSQNQVVAGGLHWATRSLPPPQFRNRPT